MPRPRIDEQAVRDRIIEIAETLLIESSGRRLVLSDIAARMGVSQPYVYRHFKNKDALVAELARRWFEKVEEDGENICNSSQSWQDKLRTYVLSMLQLKRKAYDANPELFAAYLRFAESHGAVVEQHIKVLVDQIRRILVSSVPENDLENIVNLVLDATVQFRVPAAIMSAPLNATPQRAKPVLNAIIEYIERRGKSE